MSAPDSPTPAPWPFVLLRRAEAWAKVYRILDHDLLPADGRITSLDQLVTRPAAHWQDRWLPHFTEPDELIPHHVFEQRLQAALSASA